MPYRLEKYNVNPEWPIYKQVVHYYDLCKFDWNYTDQTMNGKVSSINHFLRYSHLQSDMYNIKYSAISPKIR